MTADDDTRKAQGERAKRLRQAIEELRQRGDKGLDPAPKTPRDFVDPRRRRGDQPEDDSGTPRR